MRHKRSSGVAFDIFQFEFSPVSAFVDDLRALFSWECSRSSKLKFGISLTGRVGILGFHHCRLGRGEQLLSWRWWQSRVFTSPNTIFFDNSVALALWQCLNECKWLYCRSGIWTLFRIAHRTSCHCYCLYVLLPSKQVIFLAPTV